MLVWVMEVVLIGDSGWQDHGGRTPENPATSGVELGSNG